METHWAREYEKAIRAVRSLNYSSWFDLWHTHLDWKSKGNRFLESRANVARITYELLKEVEHLASQAGHPIQVFGSICEDTGSNAVYIHSENPNGNPFPYIFSDVEWGVDCPPELDGIVDWEAYEVGKASHSDSVDFIVRKRG